MSGWKISMNWPKNISEQTTYLAQQINIPNFSIRAEFLIKFMSIPTFQMRTAANDFSNVPLFLTGEI